MHGFIGVFDGYLADGDVRTCFRQLTRVNENHGRDFDVCWVNGRASFTSIHRHFSLKDLSPFGVQTGTCFAGTLVFAHHDEIYSQLAFCNVVEESRLATA